MQPIPTGSSKTLSGCILYFIWITVLQCSILTMNSCSLVHASKNRLLHKQSWPPTVEIVDTNYLTVYLSQNAAFGNRVSTYSHINVMYPPQDQMDLCEYPASLKALNKTSNLNAYDIPIAFVIPYMPTLSCTPERQALIAKRIQSTVTKKLQYLIIYGTDPNDGDLLEILYPDVTPITSNSYTSNATDDAVNSSIDLSNICILYLNYKSGVDLQNKIMNHNESILSDPHYGAEENFDWSLILRIGPYEVLDSSTQSQSDNFSWLRIVLFSLLIASPCCRAAYLWYAAGGRFQLRRNDAGRITGILYVPPTRHWLPNITGRIRPTFMTLSEEKFNELPEVIYEARPRACDDEGNNDIEDQNNDVSIGTSAPLDVSEKNVVSTDENENLSRKGQNSDNIEFVLDPVPDVENGSAGETNSGFANNNISSTETKPESTLHSTTHTDTDTCLGASAGLTKEGADAGISSLKALPTPTILSSCTVCSICIDDFEDGERLILLPKCHHAFHRDCIHPWLTERQGCCPSCKTNVLNDDSIPDIAEAEGGETSVSTSAAITTAAATLLATSNEETTTLATSVAGTIPATGLVTTTLVSRTTATTPASSVAATAPVTSSAAVPASSVAAALSTTSSHTTAPEAL